MAAQHLLPHPHRDGDQPAPRRRPVRHAAGVQPRRRAPYPPNTLLTHVGRRRRRGHDLLHDRRRDRSAARRRRHQSIGRSQGLHGPDRRSPADATIKARFRTTAGAWSVLVEAPYDVVPAPATTTATASSTATISSPGSGNSARRPIPPGSGADGNRDGMVDAGDLAAWAGNLWLRRQRRSRGCRSAVVAAAVRRCRRRRCSRLRLSPRPRAPSTPERARSWSTKCSPSTPRLAADAGRRCRDPPAPRIAPRRRRAARRSSANRRRRGRLSTAWTPCSTAFDGALADASPPQRSARRGTTGKACQRRRG